MNGWKQLAYKIKGARMAVWNHLLVERNHGHVYHLQFRLAWLEVCFPEATEKRMRLFYSNFSSIEELQDYLEDPSFDYRSSALSSSSSSASSSSSSASFQHVARGKLRISSIEQPAAALQKKTEKESIIRNFPPPSILDADVIPLC